jgi:hypothetical protein
MLSRAVICPHCRRVVAVGAGLPASCFAGIPEPDRHTLPRSALETHPAAHLDCLEIEVRIPDGLTGETLLKEVERAQREEIAVLADLVAGLAPAT